MLLIMFRFLWKNHFTCIALTYVTLCRNLLWQWCLKSTKARLLSTHLFPPAMYVCFAFFGNIIFRLGSIYVSDSLFYMKLTYMLLYMQAPSEALVHEEHQTSGPPLTSQQVCLCTSLSLYICVHILIVTLNMYPNFDTTCFMQVS